MNTHKTNAIYAPNKGIAYIISEIDYKIKYIIIGNVNRYLTATVKFYAVI